MRPLFASIVYGMFLGCLWFIFVQYIVTYINALEHRFWLGALFIVTVTVLFGKIFDMIFKNLNVKGKSMRITGAASFACVIFVAFLI